MAIFLVCLVISNAQDQKPDTTKSSKDEEKVQILPDLDWDFDFQDFNFKISDNPVWKSSPKRPFVEFSLGNARLKDKEYDNIPFKDNYIFDLTLGYYKYKEHQKSILTKTTTDEFFISNISDKIIDPNTSSLNAKSDIWRFGFNDKKSYGYRFHKNLRFDLGHSEGMGWSYLSFDPYTYKTNFDTNYTEKFNTFDESVRFGEQFKSYASIILFEKLSLNASYERINVYPRHMFWYWSLSKIIEAGGQGLVDQFVNEIREFSPEFTPVFSFILKSGLSYGIYELRKKNMNWPVKTAPPLTFENVRIGASFNF